MMIVNRYILTVIIAIPLHISAMELQKTQEAYCPRAYFDREIEGLLIDLLRNSNVSIWVASYTANSKRFIDELGSLCAKGLHSCVLSSLQRGDEEKKEKKDQEKKLRENVSEHLLTGLVKGLKKGSRSLMHNKFIIFAANTYESHKARPLVLTGSCNLTDESLEINHENAVLIDDCGIILGYYREFLRLFDKAQFQEGKERNEITSIGDKIASEARQLARTIPPKNTNLDAWFRADIKAFIIAKFNENWDSINGAQFEFTIDSLRILVPKKKYLVLF